MKFSELDSGMVVEVRGGDRYLVLKNKDGDVNLMNVNRHTSLSGWGAGRRYTESMLSWTGDCFDIMRVYSEVFTFDGAKGTDLCVWVRNDPKEMTLDDVSAALGYPVKIVD